MLQPLRLEGETGLSSELSLDASGMSNSPLQENGQYW